MALPEQPQRPITSPRRTWSPTRMVTEPHCRWQKCVISFGPWRRRPRCPRRGRVAPAVEVVGHAVLGPLHHAVGGSEDRRAEAGSPSRASLAFALTVDALESPTRSGREPQMPRTRRGCLRHDPASVNGGVRPHGRARGRGRARAGTRRDRTRAATRPGRHARRGRPDGPIAPGRSRRARRTRAPLRRTPRAVEPTSISASAIANSSAGGRTTVHAARRSVATQSAAARRIAVMSESERGSTWYVRKLAA